MSNTESIQSSEQPTAAAQAAPCFALRNIDKAFPVASDSLLGGGMKQILCKVSLSLQPGEIFGFIGLNGAGKTTTIKIALGLTHADAGEIEYFGSPHAQLDWRRIGFAPEKPSFNEFLSAHEVLMFSERLLQRTPDPTRYPALLERVALADALHQRVGTYSKGMQQRLALAAAMLHDPELLILDEPSSGLDPLGRALIKDIMRDLKKAGKSIFFSTHILPDVEELCDRIGIIHHGRILYTGRLTEFAGSGTNLERRFMDLIESSDATVQRGTK